MMSILVDEATNTSEVDRLFDMISVSTSEDKANTVWD